MAYKNRYLFIRRTYPNTIVIFKNKNDLYVGYSEQKEFLKYLKFQKINDLNKLNINYIVVSNMSIIEHKKFNNNNNYSLYYTRFKLFILVNNFLK